MIDRQGGASSLQTQSCSVHPQSQKQLQGGSIRGLDSTSAPSQSSPEVLGERTPAIWPHTQKPLARKCTWHCAAILIVTWLYHIFCREEVGGILASSDYLNSDCLRPCRNPGCMRIRKLHWSWKQMWSWKGSAASLTRLLIGYYLLTLTRVDWKSKYYRLLITFYSTELCKYLTIQSESNINEKQRRYSNVASETVIWCEKY